MRMTSVRAKACNDIRFSCPNNALAQTYPGTDDYDILFSMIEEDAVANVASKEEHNGCSQQKSDVERNCIRECQRLHCAKKKNAT